MKIGIDIRTLMDARYSGVSEYTYNLVKELLKQDKENKYILFYNSFRNVGDRIPKFEGNYEVIRTQYPNKIFNYFLQKIFKYPKIDKLIGGVDIFWSPHINFFSLSSTTKKILTVHDLSFLRYPEYFSLRKNIWHKTLNVRKMIKNFDLIIAVSENTAKDIIELVNINPEKVKVVYSGVEQETINDLDKEDIFNIKKKYSIPEKYILHLGTVEPRKNIQGLIKAYNKLRDTNSNFEQYKLLIAGEKGWKSEAIFEEWENSPYKEDIIFTGYVEKEDKPYLYSIASVFVYPSFYEGFGFPPLEAMFNKTPVITSFSSSLGEITGGASIMIDPYNIDDIAKAIEVVLENTELKEELIKKGIVRSGNFNWPDTAKNYLEIFKNF